MKIRYNPYKNNRNSLSNEKKLSFAHFFTNKHTTFAQNKHFLP